MYSNGVATADSAKPASGIAILVLFASVPAPPTFVTLAVTVAPRLLTTLPYSSVTLAWASNC